MQNLKLALGALCLGFLLLMSCNDPTLIGGDVLGGDEFNIESTEDIEILASTVYAEPVRTYDTIINFQLTDYLLGQIDNPIFGSYKSSIYVEFDINGGLKPNFDGQILDSAVIILPFDGLNTYGEALGQSFDIQLSELSSRFEDGTNHFSDEEVSTMGVLETVTVVPSMDSVAIALLNTMDLDTVHPQIRIPVPMVLAQKIFTNTDSINFNSNNDFQNFFAGLELKPVGGSNGVFGVQLRASGRVARMQFFSHDTIQKSYSFPVGSFATKFTTFDHDPTGSIVEDFVEQGKSGGDSLLFVQSLEGTDIQLEFANLADLQGIVVNKAELIFEADSLSGDDFELYPLTEQMMINEVTEDGETELIEDLIILIGRYGSTDGLAIFGGSPDEDRVYRMNISGHFQRMIDGDATNILRITPFNSGGDLTGLNRGNKASRTVIKGPGRTTGRMKLVLNYTKI
ncbi:MAG: hypothetical protein ACI9XO_000496 [Paraglaciecola sp.]|jgi:hypothetical protein